MRNATLSVGDLIASNCPLLAKRRRLAVECGCASGAGSQKHAPCLGTGGLMSFYAVRPDVRYRVAIRAMQIPGDRVPAPLGLMPLSCLLNCHGYPAPVLNLTGLARRAAALLPAIAP